MSRKSQNSRRLPRFVFIVAGVLLLIAVAVVAGFGTFKTWRARDLAAKAMENFDNGNLRMAWIQINSARSLKPDSPNVLRASAIIEIGVGLPSGLAYWNQFAAQQNLTPEDLALRAEAAARFGSEREFEQAAGDLEAAGNPGTAGRLRSARKLARGDMDRAIEEARRLADALDDPALRLDVARLLFRRHVDRLTLAPQSEASRAIFDEMSGIVEAVQGTPVAEEALAFGLVHLQPGEGRRGEWAAAAMENVAPENPALLPAATALVQLGQATPEDLHRRLRPVFDATPLDRRADFAGWLIRQGMPREALTLITAQEAGEELPAFAVRTEALAQLENWNAILETVQAGGNIPATARFLARARAEYALGRGDQSGAMSLGEALRASFREGNSAAVVAIADQMGASAVVDQTIVGLCSDPRLANSAFRTARDRFSRRGPSGSALLAAAYEGALVAAPNGVAVQNYTRYRKLLDDIEANGLRGADAAPPDELVVDPAETAAAIEDAAPDEAVRATHALALIQAGRGEESFATFEDFTIHFHRLPPPIQAVLAASAASSGQPGLAAEMVRRINAERLGPGELVLLELPGPSGSAHP